MFSTEFLISVRISEIFSFFKKQIFFTKIGQGPFKVIFRIKISAKEKMSISVLSLAQILSKNVNNDVVKYDKTSRKIHDNWIC